MSVFIDIAGNVGIGTNATTAPVVIRTNNATGAGMVVNQTGTGAAIDIQKSGASKIYVDASGNVGIGTNASTYPFVIQANSSTVGMVLNNVGTGAVVDIQKAGASKMFIDATGNVGFGTSSTTSPLVVQTTNTTGTGVVLNQAGTSAILDVQKAGVSTMFIDASGNVGIGSASPIAPFNVQTNSTDGTGMVLNQVGTNAILDIQKSGTSKMFMDAAGNIGIGNTAPLSPFNVQVNNNTGTGVVINQTGNGAVLDIQEAGVSKMFVDPSGNIGFGSTTPLAPFNVQTNNSTGTGVVINQTGNGAVLDIQEAGVSKMFVDSLGNIGIGSTAPLAPLNVQTNNTTGTGIVFSQIGTSAILDIQKSGVSKVFMDATGNVGIGSTVPLAPLNVQTSNTTGTGVIFSQIGTSAILDVQKSGTSKFFMDTVGNVGVGTTTPSQTVHIEGNAYINGSISANNLGVYRNRLINGDMRVNQRGTANTSGTLQAVGATYGYVTDRWGVYRAGYAAGGNMGHGTNLTSADLPYSRYGIKTYARIGRVAADTSTAVLGIAYGLETQDSLSLAGQTVTCSFFYRTGANYSGLTLNTNIATGTGTDDGIQRGATIAGGLNNSNAVPPSSTWAFRSVTAQLSSAATQVGVLITYTPVGTAGAADYFDITGIQLEKGNIATPFEFRPYAAELELCQRYYYRMIANNLYSFFGAGMTYSATLAYFMIPHRVQMRTTPTLDASAANTFIVFAVATGTAPSAIAIKADGNTINSASIEVTTTTLTAGQGAILRANNSTAAYLGFSAEL